MELEMDHYAGGALQVLLLALTVLGLVLNVLFLVLMYRKAMGYPGLFEKASNVSGEMGVSGATVA